MCDPKKGENCYVGLVARERWKRFTFCLLRHRRTCDRQSTQICHKIDTGCRGSIPVIQQITSSHCHHFLTVSMRQLFRTDYGFLLSLNIFWLASIVPVHPPKISVSEFLPPHDR